jgi:hypothetical protein
MRQKMKVSKVVSMTPTELEDLSHKCARAGCTNTWKGEMPPGWVFLITYWAPWPDSGRTVAEVVFSPFCKRDAGLCPKHAEELEGMLEQVGHALRKTEGNA